MTPRAVAHPAQDGQTPPPPSDLSPTRLQTVSDALSPVLSPEMAADNGRPYQLGVDIEPETFVCMAYTTGPCDTVPIAYRLLGHRCTLDEHHDGGHECVSAGRGGSNDALEWPLLPLPPIRKRLPMHNP